MSSASFFLYLSSWFHISVSHVLVMMQSLYCSVEFLAETFGALRHRLTYTPTRVKHLQVPQAFYLCLNRVMIPVCVITDGHRSKFVYSAKRLEQYFYGCSTSSVTILQTYYMFCNTQKYVNIIIHTIYIFHLYTICIYYIIRCFI